MTQHHLSSPVFKQLSWNREGNGNQCLVLIHGFPEDENLWRKVVLPLSGHYTILLPSLPGAGNSVYDTGNLTVDVMADAINAMLEAAGISQAVIAGHSMGGYVALAFAERYPHKVSGISLVHSTASADTDDKKNTRTKTVELLKKNGGRDAFIRQMVPNLFSGAFVAANPAEVAEQVALAEKIAAPDMIAFTTAMRDRKDRTYLLAGFHFPVQYILGKDDNIISLSLGIQQSVLPGVSFLSVYEHCGHMIMIEQPALLCKDLLEFAAYCAARKY